MDVLHDELREERDQKVPEPITCCRERHAWCSVASGVQLSHDGPDQWSPGRCKGDDEQAGEDNEDVAGCRRR